MNLRGVKMRLGKSDLDPDEPDPPKVAAMRGSFDEASPDPVLHPENVQSVAQLNAVFKQLKEQMRVSGVPPPYGAIVHPSVAAGLAGLTFSNNTTSFDVSPGLPVPVTDFVEVHVTPAEVAAMDPATDNMIDLFAGDKARSRMGVVNLNLRFVGRRGTLGGGYVVTFERRPS